MIYFGTLISVYTDEAEQQITETILQKRSIVKVPIQIVPVVTCTAVSACGALTTE